MVLMVHAAVLLGGRQAVPSLGHLRMLMFYAIVWPITLYSLYVYGSIIVYIRRVAGTTKGADAEGTKRITSTIGRLACFPVILMISMSFASTNRVYQFIYQRDPPFWVFEAQVALHMLVSPSLASQSHRAAGVSGREGVMVIRDLCFVVDAARRHEHRRLRLQPASEARATEGEAAFPWSGYQPIIC
jgi:hypothetical protein